MLWWSAVVLVAIAFLIRRLSVIKTPSPEWRKIDPIAAFAVVGTAVILVLTGMTAAWSPPNSADAMAYHMPRVLYWAEQGSVHFFPTQYLNQIMLQPLAEYFMLHLYILSGNDHLINFVQWFGWLGSVIAVTCVARMFGATVRGQAIAGLFCATIPSGVLASSGAKNDCLLAFWLVSAVYFAFRLTRNFKWIDAMFFGAVVGLALCTKATAYLFAPLPILAVILESLCREAPANRLKTVAVLSKGIALAGLIVLVVNAPQYVRNYRLSGSVLGFDSAQGDGFFRWRNETFGWKQTLSNVLRNTSEQLGQRSPRWNQSVYDAVLDLHRRLHIDPDDPATTWRWSLFHVPKNANHEADSPNPWQGAILLFACLVLTVKAFRRGDWLPVWYALALALNFLAFCAYLKWQPFLARLFIPQFVLGAPLVGLLFPGDFSSRWMRILNCAAAAGLCLFLLDNARHPVLDNWVRPLRGPLSVFTRPRDAQYFADMTPWKNEGAFEKTVQLLAAGDCLTLGVDITDFQLEYPLEALLREKNPAFRFVHIGVENASRNYVQPVPAAPCAVVCLECAADQKRLSGHSLFPRRDVIEGFVVLRKQ
jgi:hypothetical protein